MTSKIPTENFIKISCDNAVSPIFPRIKIESLATKIPFFPKYLSINMTGYPLNVLHHLFALFVPPLLLLVHPKPNSTLLFELIIEVVLRRLWGAGSGAWVG